MTVPVNVPVMWYGGIGSPFSSSPAAVMWMTPFSTVVMVPSSCPLPMQGMTSWNVSTTLFSWKVMVTGLAWATPVSMASPTSVADTSTISRLT